MKWFLKFYWEECLVKYQLLTVGPEEPNVKAKSNSIMKKLEYETLFDWFALFLNSIMIVICIV